MIRSIRKFTRRNRGLEALQAVILVGLAFFILAAVNKLWRDNRDNFNTNISSIINGQEAPETN